MQIPNLGGKYIVRGRCKDAEAGPPEQLALLADRGRDQSSTALPRNAPDVRRMTEVDVSN